MHICIYAWCIYPWSLILHVWCIYLCSSILDSDACVYDAHIYDPRSLILMHVCMMHISMILDLDPEACMYVYMRVWCIYQCSSILDSDACVYDAHIYDPWSFILIHACMMHLSVFLDPWLWCIHVCIILDRDVCMHVRCIDSWPWHMWPWCTYLLCIYTWSWYMRVWCIYQCSLILDSDACVYDAHIYDPRSLILIHACMMHLSMFLDP